MASSLQQGITAAKAGRMQDALDYLKDAIIEEPQNAEVWVWIAAIIDDLNKQEIFLDKALEIDPNNIPAQRGLAYLQKRKREAASVQDDHLSDHTTPISPFPASEQPRRPEKNIGWSKLTSDDLGKMGLPTEEEKTDTLKSTNFFQNLPKLTPLEISLLGVVVVVFCFIGLLAASALFDFQLPLEFLVKEQPKLATEPPYPGVFLYEDAIFFDIQQHQGLPSYDVGIPTSFEQNPVIVLWQSDADPGHMKLIYQTGEYIPFEEYQAKDANLIQAVDGLGPGLYCFQQLPDSQDFNEAFYWCFKISTPLVEE